MHTINTFAVLWSEGFTNLEGLYIPIQILVFNKNKTQVIATDISLEIQYTLLLTYKS